MAVVRFIGGPIVLLQGRVVHYWDLDSGHLMQELTLGLDHEEEAVLLQLQLDPLLSKAALAASAFPAANGHLSAVNLCLVRSLVWPLTPRGMFSGQLGVPLVSLAGADAEACTHVLASRRQSAAHSWAVARQKPAVSFLWLSDCCRHVLLLSPAERVRQVPLPFRLQALRTVCLHTVT